MSVLMSMKKLILLTKYLEIKTQCQPFSSFIIINLVYCLQYSTVVSTVINEGLNLSTNENVGAPRRLVRHINGRFCFQAFVSLPGILPPLFLPPQLFIRFAPVTARFKPRIDFPLGFSIFFLVLF